MKKRKRGGQRKHPAERKSAAVNFRVLKDLRRKLIAEAQKSGRSLSEECAWRLTISLMFDNEIQSVAQIQKNIAAIGERYEREHNGHGPDAGRTPASLT